MKYPVFLTLFVCFLTLFSVNASAQVGGLSQTTVNIELNPEMPSPRSPVSVTLTSYVTDINAADITYKVNGKILKTGKGEKTFDFTVGEINTTTVLEISIVTAEGDLIENTYEIKPIAVDLIWQSEGIVPPFYKGKTLFSHQDKITFIAMPHMFSAGGQEIAPKNLIYKWSKNGTVMDKDSGYGKSTYTMTGPLISRGLSIRVEVTSPTSSDRGFALTSVNPVDPTIVFYRKNPSLGIEFQKAIPRNFKMTDSKEIAVIGVPFFFGGIDPKAKELVYKWNLNGVPVNTDKSANTQIFRQKEGSSGVSNISLSVENTQKILQYASSNFNLEFGNPANTNISF